MEIMNLKITNIQIKEYSQTQSMPILQKIADALCNDEEIQYVTTTSNVASINKIVIGNAKSIYTKLKEYPYEFEINESLQLAAIDGKQINNVNNSNSLPIMSKIEETTEITNFSYTGKYQEFTVEEDGYYKIECWGASAGQKSQFLYICGRGAYTKGIIHLNKDEKLYIYVGGQGHYGNDTTAGGYNGGGKILQPYYNDSNNSSGGGATDVRIVDGESDDFTSLLSRIMVAGGGGGCHPNYGGHAGTIKATTGSGLIAATQTTGNKLGLGKSSTRVGRWRRILWWRLKFKWISSFWRIILYIRSRRMQFNFRRFNRR